jgi:glyoxylase-like metal-dependent hydrolase (beta-lactamase superfamily II)
MRRFVSVGLCALGVLGGGGDPVAQQPQDRLKAAVDTLGVAKVTSLRLVGSGAAYSVGQSPSPGDPWPRVTVKHYDATIDFATPAMRVDITRDRGVSPPRGGGQPFTGEQRVLEYVNDESAWDVPMAPAAGPASTPLPQPAAATERILQVFLTPPAFLKAAVANYATSRSVPEGTEVSFSVPPGRRFVGIINARNQVERVRTWNNNPVLGDMVIEATYTDYQAVPGGLQFPMRIVQTQGGYPSLDLRLTSVEANAKADLAVPKTVVGAASPPLRVDIERVADGVLWLTGGSHHSVAIEMRDHVILVEAPLNEPRSEVLLAALKQAIPTKPIRFVVNTHPHFDHAGGLRTFVAEGAAVVTHEINRPFFETAWARSRTLGPDRLAQSGGKAMFQTFRDRHVLTDGTRVVELHRIAGSPHHDGFAMVYLPAEKLLIEADAYTPAVAGAASASNPTAANLHDNIRRLKLDVARIAPLHGPRVATLGDLAKAIGR